MTTPLIPRSIIFGNPDKASVQISPDGLYLSYLAPKDGVLNVYVAEISDLSSAKPVTNDTSRGIRSYGWLHTGEHLLYSQDTKGDENWHAHVVNIQTEEDTDIMPFGDVRVGGTKVSYKYPKEFLIQINKRDRQYFDIYKYNLDTKTLDLVYENKGGFNGFIMDDEYNIRFAQKPRNDGSFDIYIFDKELTPTLYIPVPYEDINTTQIIGFNKANDTVYALYSIGRNTSALISIDLATNEKKTIYETDKADVNYAMISPVEKVVQQVGYEYTKQAYVVLDSTIQADMTYLESVEDGEVNVTSRDLKDKTWIVAFSSDIKPAHYYIYNRETRKAKFLFSGRSDIEKYELAPMQHIIIKSRDELDLISYLTVPCDIKHPVPLVLDVHGGPTARDSWGMNAIHQWLSNRGYAVLSVNYRGSSGFGKDFINKGYGEWGRKMHDDLIDAVNWAIDSKITTADKVAIFGGSYGGYAVLSGLAFTPDTFACGVDIVGVSNLITLLKSIPPYWKPYYTDLMRKVGGDPDTEEGRKFLESRSPLTFADRIKKPLLIGHGANDPRVKQAESDQIVAAMEAKGIPFTYALYPDEGHGFARPENRMSFFAIAEEFLQKHLGGRAEPKGNAFEGSSIQIKE